MLTRRKVYRVSFPKYRGRPRLPAKSEARTAIHDARSVLRNLKSQPDQADGRLWCGRVLFVSKVALSLRRCRKHTMNSLFER